MSSHNNGSRWFSESELVVESLRNLGIDVTMTVKDGPARSATQRTGEYDLMYWWPGYGFEPSDWFGYSVYSVDTRYDQPVSGLIDLALDEMVVAMNSEMDPIVRYGLVADLQRYLTERQYVVYSTNWIQIVAVAPWLKNYQYHYDFTTSPSMRHAWIDRSGM
jgi:ABC-type transport system substrate-binding protein